MKQLLHNSILTKTIIGFMFVCVLLVPMSLSYTSTSNSETQLVQIQISIEENVAFAQGATAPAEATAPAGNWYDILDTRTDAQKKAQAEEQAQLKPKTDNAKNIVSWARTKFLDATISVVVNTVGQIFLTLASAVTWTGGMLLEYTLDWVVFGMGERINGTVGLSAAINSVWGLVRDICNLVFIFGFIYTGIRTIIDPDSASTKRFLTKIIVGALLINFSLFIVKFVIDFANYLTYQIFINLTTDSNFSISEKIVDMLGIVTYYNLSVKTITALIDDVSAWYYVFGFIFLLIAGFVFIASAVLLIVRFVALVLIMIASPLLFAATVFPQTESYANDLWKNLFRYAFFAPAYMLLTLISIKMLEPFVVAGDFADTFTGEGLKTAGSFAVVLNYIVVIFFMVASLTIAQKMGIKGGDIAVKVGKTLKGKATSALGRTTVGKWSHKLNEKYEKFDAQTKDSKNWNRLKTVGKFATLGAINDRTVRETLHAGEHAKFGGSYSFEDDEKYGKERKARQATTLKLEGFKEIIKKGTAIVNGVPVVLSDDEKIKFERAVADATSKDLEELKQEQREAIAGLMTQGQIDGLMKSEKLTETDKGSIGKQRAAQISKLYVQNKELLSKASGDQLAALGEAYLSTEEHAVRLTSAQMDDLKKKFTATEFKRLSDTRESALTKLSSGGTISTMEKSAKVTLNQEFITKQKPGEIAKLPTVVLTQKNLAPVFPVSALEKIVRDGTLNQNDQATIRTNIEDIINEYMQGTYNGVMTPDQEKHILSLEKWLVDSPVGRQLGK